jgi:hypothetical protein
VKKYDEDLVPIPAADNEVLGNVQMVLDKLNGIIYNKISLFETVPESMHRFLDISDYKSIASSLGEINKVDEVISLYNAVIRNFLQPSTMTASSKIAFQTKLQTLAQNIQVIYNKLERIILIYIKEFNITRPRTQGAQADKMKDSLLNIGRIIARMLSTFCVYRIIKEQIETGNFQIIELDSFEHEVKRLSDRNPEVRMFLKKLEAEIDPRLHPNIIGQKLRGTPESKADYLNRMTTDKLTAYESELGRPMSEEERRLFFPYSASTAISPPAALAEGDELPALEEADEAKKQQIKETRAYIKKKKMDLKRMKYPTLSAKQVDAKTRRGVNIIYQQIRDAGEDATFDDAKKIIDDYFQEFFFESRP